MKRERSAHEHLDGSTTAAVMFVKSTDAKENKLRLSCWLISDKEDFALGYLIDQADRTKKVSRERIMKQLGRS